VSTVLLLIFLMVITKLDKNQTLRSMPIQTHRLPLLLQLRFKAQFGVLLSVLNSILKVFLQHPFLLQFMVETHLLLEAQVQPFRLL
jgi:hypothetical protein